MAVYTQFDHKPALFNAMRLALPTPTETLLLRACLTNGDTCCQAWMQWVEAVRDLKQYFIDDTKGIKRILPLLYESLRNNQVEVDKEFLPYLKTAYVREGMRAATFQRICKTALTALKDANISFVILKGVSLTETVYKCWAHRHSHDIDLWVDETQMQATAEALESVQFTPVQVRHPYPTYTFAGQDSTLIHSSGLPLTLHTSLLRQSYYPLPTDRIKARTQAAKITGVEAQILSHADSLLHVIGHAAMEYSREMLCWVYDAYHVIQHMAEADWQTFLQTVEQSQLALPVYVLLNFLAVELNAPIPHPVLQQLSLRAEEVQFEAYQPAIYGVRVTNNVSVEDLLSASQSWKDRRILIRWLLLPSPAYLCPNQAEPPTWKLPMLYAQRVGRYSTQQLRKKLSVLAKNSVGA
jgi:hypothetical protein